MVESVWWRDGYVGHSPPLFDDEVGEGWLVIGSEMACDILTRRFGVPKRVVRVKRSFYQNGQQLQNVTHVVQESGRDFIW
jgi:hypothetical protein